MQPKRSKSQPKTRSKFGCLFWRVCWFNFDQIGCQNGDKLGPKSRPKRTLTRKRLNRLNVIKTNTFSMILGFGATGLRTQTDQKSMKKRSQCRSAFRDRFFIHFWSILDAFWEVKWVKKRSKKPSKKRPRKKKGREGPKGRFWAADVDRSAPSWPRGGPPL